jgi:putative ABC transport system ATP-binding protein
MKQNLQVKHEPLIDLNQVSKRYEGAAGDFSALKAISLRVQSGEFVAIVGKSGSGKSTLINMMTGIDRPTFGEVRVAGATLNGMREDDLAVWRGRNVGVVFQFFQLLPTLSVIENIMLPMDLCGELPERERRTRALSLLARVDIAEQADKLPATLSGGQQQRAAIARALANNPPLIVADEPTGNLDSRTTDAVFELFTSLAREGKTVVMVTHDRDVTRWVNRTITLADGCIVSDTNDAGTSPIAPNPQPKNMREVAYA